MKILTHVYPAYRSPYPMGQVEPDQNDAPNLNLTEGLHGTESIRSEICNSNRPEVPLPKR